MRNSKVEDSGPDARTAWEKIERPKMQSVQALRQKAKLKRQRKVKTGGRLKSGANVWSTRAHGKKGLGDKSRDAHGVTRFVAGSRLNAKRRRYLKGGVNYRVHEGGGWRKGNLEVRSSRTIQGDEGLSVRVRKRRVSIYRHGKKLKRGVGTVRSLTMAEELRKATDNQKKNVYKNREYNLQPPRDKPAQADHHTRSRKFPEYGTMDGRTRRGKLPVQGIGKCCYSGGPE